MKNILENKVIVVTGGSGLIGKAIVNEIESNGGIAINADISNQNESDSNKYFLDITSEKSIRELIDTILNKFGKLDGWVNNAYPRTADWGVKFEKIPFESWQKNVDMHLNGYFLCSKLIIEQMVVQNYGAIVNMASIYGILAPDFSIYENTEMTSAAAYSVIKGGIVNFTRYLASYFGKNNIRVNTVSPGGIFNNQNPEFVKKYEKKTPLARMGKPEDIAPAISFLLSDSSSFITGQNIIIDGGWSII
ncbi:MAG: oxidoreductase [Bacteroidota bacterium]|jgi:NAD(P)-dependent dehydrogenase (short-subunit alcohol dehydrogenase family)